MIVDWCREYRDNTDFYISWVLRIYIMKNFYIPYKAAVIYTSYHCVSFYIFIFCIGSTPTAKTTFSFFSFTTFSKIYSSNCYPTFVNPNPKTNAFLLTPIMFLHSSTIIMLYLSKFWCISTIHLFPLIELVPTIFVSKTST